MSLSRHGKEGVSSVHEITGDELVRVDRAGHGGGIRDGGLEENGEEHILVFLHRLVDL